LSEALDAERHGMVALASSPDVIEAMRAFLERRPAVFSPDDAPHPGPIVQGP